MKKPIIGLLIMTPLLPLGAMFFAFGFVFQAMQVMFEKGRTAMIDLVRD